MTTEAGRAEMTKRALAMMDEADQRTGNRPGRDHTPNSDSGASFHPWAVAAEGGRHAAIVGAAGYCAHRGYDVNHAVLVLSHWNQSNRPPETSVELEKQVRDVYARYGHGDADDAEDPPFLRLSEHRVDTIPKRPWLIPGFLPAGQRVALLGRWGSGKSLVALEAAHAIAHATTFLDWSEPSARGPVVILDGEGGEWRAIGRYNALRAGRNLGSGPCEAGEPDIYWRAASGLSLSRGHSIERLRAALLTLEPKLIIFDTLAKVMGLSDENSNAMAARMTQALYELNQELDASLLLIAHPSKSDGGAHTVRGAGEFSADLDVIWSVIKEDDTRRRVCCQKDRDGDLEKTSFQFTIEDRDGAALVVGDDDCAAETFGDTDNTIVKMLLAGSLSAHDLIVRVGEECQASRTTVYVALKRLEAHGLVTSRNGTWSCVPKTPA